MRIHQLENCKYFLRHHAKLDICLIFRFGGFLPVEENKQNRIVIHKNMVYLFLNYNDNLNIVSSIEVS
jgi:hypothetical protein